MAIKRVLTPGGYRHPSLVHEVPAGHAVKAQAGAHQILNLITNTAFMVPKKILGPGDVPGFGTGWIVYAWWQNSTGQPVTEFRTTWKVPPGPRTDSNQVIYLFNGIDPTVTSAGIIQPVLQWGSGGASSGSGKFWAVASWYAEAGGQAFHTPLVRVSEGDTLVGVIRLVGQGGGAFSYTSEFEGIAGTKLEANNMAELTWCNLTLEAYGIELPSDYPDADLTAMRAIEIKIGAIKPTVNWMAVDQVTDLGQHAVVSINSGDGGEVNLYYRTV